MSGQRPEDFGSVIHVVLGHDPTPVSRITRRYFQRNNNRGMLIRKRSKAERWFGDSLVYVVSYQWGVEEERQPLSGEEEAEREESMGDHFW